MTREYLKNLLRKRGWEESPGVNLGGNKITAFRKYANAKTVWRKDGPWLHLANACEEAGLHKELGLMLIAEQRNVF